MKGWQVFVNLYTTKEAIKFNIQHCNCSKFAARNCCCEAVLQTFISLWITKHSEQANDRKTDLL
jgi:hypothetical protein